jgi:hypothetical protein
LHAVAAVKHLLVAVLVASLSSASAGCSVPSKHRSSAMLGGGAMMVAGFFIAKPKPVDSDHDGTNDFFLNDDYSGFLPGSLLFVGGLALVLAGLNARDEAPVVQPPPLASPPPTVGPPGALADPSLPEVAVTVEMLQLAKQIRAAAAHGQCDAALTTWTRLAELDAAYATALMKGPVLAPCR